MKIVFIGASKFGLRCLEAIHRNPHCQVAGVITAPRSFRISYNERGVVNVLHGDFLEFGSKESIPTKAISDGMKDPSLLEQCRHWAPDAFIVCGWYHMIPKSWRSIAPAYGMHASLLPDFSGGAPLVWAMIEGVTETGITLFELSDGVDNGPIIAQKRTSILESDDIASLYARIELLGLDMLIEQIPHLAAGSPARLTQDENLRRVFPQRSPDDGLINWRQSARDIWNFIRAQTRPYPGAFTTTQEHKLHIWKAKVTTCAELDPHAPGRLYVENGNIHVRCGNGTLQIIEADYKGLPLDPHRWRNEVGEGTMLGA